MHPYMQGPSTELHRMVGVPVIMSLGMFIRASDVKQWCVTLSSQLQALEIFCSRTSVFGGAFVTRVSGDDAYQRGYPRDRVQVASGRCGLGVLF